MFLAGDTIVVSYFDSSIPAEDNRALSFVHGTDAAGRIRMGSAGGSERDYTVYTVNAFPTIAATETFYARQYIVVDRYMDMHAHAVAWVNETTQGLYGGTERTGQSIVLYSLPSNNASFSAAVSYMPLCGVAHCNGSTVPSLSTVAHFAITCGNVSYFGSNLYHFTPQGSTDAVRAYACDLPGATGDTRPRIVYMGYFVEGACSPLATSAFEDNVCLSVALGAAIGGIISLLALLAALLALARQSKRTAVVTTPTSRARATWKAQPLGEGQDARAGADEGFDSSPGPLLMQRCTQLSVAM